MTSLALIDDFVVEGNRVTAVASSSFHEKFLREDLFVEYDKGTSLDGIAPSILAIPFLLNVLPLIWLSGETYFIKEMDARLAGSLKAIQNAFLRLYPEGEWSGRLVVGRLVERPKSGMSSGSAALFTGGVDSSYTALMCRDTLKALLTILGTQGFENGDAEKTHANIRRYMRHAGSVFGMESHFILSNVFRFIAPAKLVGLWPRPRRWLVEAQYGMGFVGLAAPVMASKGWGKLILSGCELDHYGLPSASHPDVVNEIRWNGVRVVEEGRHQRRQQKVGALHDQLSRRARWQLGLKPCLRPNQEFENCCACSKCLQTIMGILGEGGDPQAYGFDVDPATASRELRRQLESQRMPLPDVGELLQWMDIQRSIRRIACAPCESKEAFDAPPDDIFWFARFDLARYFARHQSKLRRALRAARTRVALRLDAWPMCEDPLRRMLRPLLRWR